MRFLRHLILSIGALIYYALGRIGEYIGNHKLPFAVFGASFGVLGFVTAFAAVHAPPDQPEFWKHILRRNLELHIFASLGLYMLFARVVLVFERVFNARCPWWAWYFLPVAMVMLISVCQEYWYSLMGDTAGTKGGDWMANKGDWAERMKSFGDNATWFAGAMIAAWWSYFMSKRLIRARLDYLTDIGKIERSNNEGTNTG